MQMHAAEYLGTVLYSSSVPDGVVLACSNSIFSMLTALG